MYINDAARAVSVRTQRIALEATAMCLDFTQTLVLCVKIYIGHCRMYHSHTYWVHKCTH